VKRGLEVWGDTGRVALVPVNTATCPGSAVQSAVLAGVALARLLAGDTGRVALVPMNTATSKTTHTLAAASE
jgi:hypothetical protein